MLFEKDCLRVLEVVLEPARRSRCIITAGPRCSCSTASGPIHDISPEGETLPPNRDVMRALQAWDGAGCLVVEMAPQPAGRLLNASEVPLHGIRVEMKQPPDRA